MEKMKSKVSKEAASPANKRCALCDCKETLPDAADPCVMTVYSSALKLYVCSNCYDSLREVDDFGPTKVKVLDLVDILEGDTGEDD